MDTGMVVIMDMGTLIIAPSGDITILIIPILTTAGDMVVLTGPVITTGTGMATMMATMEVADIILILILILTRATAPITDRAEAAADHPTVRTWPAQLPVEQGPRKVKMMYSHCRDLPEADNYQGIFPLLQEQGLTSFLPMDPVLHPAR
jgi:hypothetical protein